MRLVGVTLVQQRYAPSHFHTDMSTTASVGKTHVCVPILLLVEKASRLNHKCVTKGSVYCVACPFYSRYRGTVKYFSSFDEPCLCCWVENRETERYKVVTILRATIFALVVGEAVGGLVLNVDR